MSIATRLMTGAPLDWTTVPLGTFIEGGYYAGRIQASAGGVVYALIVAPKAQGEAAGLIVKVASGAADIRTTSVSNGSAGPQNASLFPASGFCRNLTINGFSDWYLPARDELEMIYRAFKPSATSNAAGSGANTNAVPATPAYTTSNPAATNVALFGPGGNEALAAEIYWSGTDISTTTQYRQSFANGAQSTATKTATGMVRAVRHVVAH